MVILPGMTQLTAGANLALLIGGGFSSLDVS